MSGPDSQEADSAMSDDKHSWQAIAAGIAPPAETSPRDPAAESLSQALRISFRLLSAIMVIIVIAFFLTGVRSVKEDQQSAIIYRFGRIVGTVDKGLCFAWPFPVGRIELVDTSIQSMEIMDFWMAETPEQRLKPLRERQPMDKGLRPAWDGALFTGDGYLIHARLKCEFHVAADAGLALTSNPLIQYKLNVNEGDPRGLTRTRELVRTAICQAAIQVAAGQTAESLKNDQARFKRDVRRRAAELLGVLEVGLEIDSVTVEATWPLQVLPSFEIAQNAAQEAKRQKNAAEAYARSQLISAAGSKYYWFVDPEEIGLELPENVGPDEPIGLIDQYRQAVREGQTARAAELLEQIDRALLHPEVAGGVRPIVDDAVAETNSMLDALEGRLRRYEQLLPEYRRNPRFVRQRLWVATREKILSAPTVEKYYVTPGMGKLILKLDRDPSTLKQIRGAMIEADETDIEH